MKKWIAWLLVLVLALSLFACTQRNGTDEQDPPENTDSGNETEKDPDNNGGEDAGSDTPSGPSYTYEVNLPSDVILTLNDKSVACIGKLAKDIFTEMDIVYEEYIPPFLDPDEYPNGLPRSLFYHINAEGQEVTVSFMTVEDFLRTDKSGVFLRRVEVDFNWRNAPDTSLMGIDVGTTLQEAFLIFGEPDLIRKNDGTLGRDTYYWRDLKIGDEEIEEVNITWQDGTKVCEVTVYFKE